MADYFYNPIIQNIAMVKNDTLSFGFQVKGFEGQTPTEIYFTVKDNPSDTDYLFQRTIGNGINLVSYDPESDTLTYTVRIDPRNTLNVNIGRYFYDLEIHTNRDTFTLLKGIFTIDWEVTSIDNETPTPGGDGDNIYYPVANPEGKKEYTETYISEIAQGILDINSLSTTYRTADMVTALSLVRDKLDDINDAINIKLGEPSSNIIPLGNMAGEIMRIQTGVSLVDYMANLAENLAAIFGYNPYGAWGLKTSDDHYLINVTDGAIILQFRLLGGSRGSLSIILRVIGSYTFLKHSFTAALYPTGKSDYYPIDSQEMDTSQYLDSTKFGTLENAPFYNRENVFYNLSSSNLPRTLAVFGNNNPYTIKNFIEGFKFGDLFNISVAGAVNAYYGEFIPWDIGAAPDLFTITDNNNRLVYNRSQGVLYAGAGYCARPSEQEYFNQKVGIGGFSTSGFSLSITLADLQAAVLFNSIDILDENGDVVIPANITPADMGITIS